MSDRVRGLDEATGEAYRDTRGRQYGAGIVCAAMAGFRRLGRVPRRGVVLIGVVIALVMAFGVVVHAAGASSGMAGRPLAVQSASLVQNGQAVVWQVELAQPFSPGALRRDGRSLRLLIERASNGSVDGMMASQSARCRSRRTTRLPAGFCRCANLKHK